jgi:hypothetical protein
VLTLFGQWSTPVNLGIAGVDDKYPQALRQQIWFGNGTLWMVWQAYRGSDWEIYSRYGGQGSWSDTLRVTNNNTNDQYPCVALDSSRYCCWCAWQNDSAGYSDICVARTYPWSVPVKITNDITADHLPSIAVIGSTVWVAWERVNDIYSSYYNGTTWAAPIPVVIGAVNATPKISARSGHPIVVWRRYESANYDICYSEYISNAWQAPQHVTSDPAVDSRPEIAQGYGYLPGIYVYWQTNRDGNYEIYRTAYDTLNINYRVTTNDSTDANPSPLYILYLVRLYEPELTFMSSRKGNPDIYYQDWGSTVPVDTNPSSDSFPVLTADRRVYKWVLWQTNRNGNSDIYGSYNYCPSEVMENISKSEPQIEMTPNPFHDRVTISLGKNIQPPGIIRIYDAAGKAVKNMLLPTACVKIPLIMTWDGTTEDGKAAAPGIYFVLINSSEAIYAGKIIKLY